MLRQMRNCCYEKYSENRINFACHQVEKSLEIKYSTSDFLLLSLEIFVGNLYAGARQAGVWLRPVDGSRDRVQLGDKTFTVRDLLYDATYCKGLLAATQEGIVLYR